VSERALLEALFAGRAHLSDSVERHMQPGLPLVGAGEPVGVARAELEHADAVLVVEDGKPVGVLTRADLLGFLVG
ncbi:MAG: CBS domain-containing protein, partial [Candidatus Phosphoribacter baldrii]